MAQKPRCLDQRRGMGRGLPSFKVLSERLDGRQRYCHCKYQDFNVCIVRDFHIMLPNPNISLYLFQLGSNPYGDAQKTHGKSYAWKSLLDAQEIVHILKNVTFETTVKCNTEEQISMFNNRDSREDALKIQQNLLRKSRAGRKIPRHLWWTYNLRKPIQHWPLGHLKEFDSYNAGGKHLQFDISTMCHCMY